ncbi:hypothetical protein [Blastopirellula marina]|uniref:Uncharacterized protein n=1 Tax=Blastopirellula marina DSM 3645 TaxID=314230 RepID=A4A318_9BACT|nr:hypothetical protein [Blastopirellula marina]EAQ76839.1 hypothetical protein DSM3645_17911 [Blastopirellula marina DSM 3645]
MPILSPDQPRFDFGVGEDASVITIADADRQADLITLQDRVAAAKQGSALLIHLPDDGGIAGRLVLGELTEEESTSWIAKGTRSVELKTGKLVVDAGGFFGQQISPESTESPDFLLVDVPPGSYQLTTYVFLSSDIATDLFRRRKLSYLDWRRKSFPNQTIPQWLVDLAEDRDNDFEEERIEQLQDDEVDTEADDAFVEVLIQLQRAAVTKEETEIASSGKLKWEKRQPEAFPQPVSTAVAAGLRGSFSKAKLVAQAFHREDFAAASQVFVEAMRTDVAAFLAKQHALISQKMTIPNRIRRNESRRKQADWDALHSDPQTVVHPLTLRRQPYQGVQVASLVDTSHRGQWVYISFELAFVKTKLGLQAAGMSVSWNAPVAPKSRKRRR